MLELTTLEDLPIFVDPDSIELIEQQEDGTCICLSSGKIVFVVESASEISFEIKKRMEEQQVVDMQLAAMRMSQ